MSERFFILGSFFALLAVAAGAFGGHLLKPRLAPDLYDIFEVAVRYHMYHALALLATAWAITQWPGTLTHAVGRTVLYGGLVLSGLGGVASIDAA
jgi:uncharacterized membrane protein YgdD (TMEM256/DUF423 family)